MTDTSEVDPAIAAVESAARSPAWGDIMKARLEQITKFGHLPDTEELQPMHDLSSRATERLNMVKEDIVLSGFDGLQHARKKLVIAIAMLIAQIDRIDRKLAERKASEREKA